MASNVTSLEPRVLTVALGNDFVEIKTITPENRKQKVSVKRKGNFNKLLIVRISEEFEFEARVIDRKQIGKGHGKRANLTDPTGNLVEDPLVSSEKSIEIRGHYESSTSHNSAQAQQRLVGALIKILAVTAPLVFVPGDEPVDVDDRPREWNFVYVFRELDGDKYGTPTRYRKPKLSPSQFRNDPVKDPDGVSTFETLGLPGEKPYLVGFLVQIYTPGPKLPNITKGRVIGIPRVEATYTPLPPGHWSLQGVNGLSREETKVALSNYAKTAKIIKNFRFRDYASVDEP